VKDFDFLSRLDCRAEFNAPSPSSFRSGGNIAAVLYPDCADKLADCVELLDREGIGYIIIGNCTNVLVNDAGIDGVVIRTNRIRGIVRDGNLIYSPCGQSISSLCAFAAESGLSGIEGLCSIPGTVGGGAAMNCGAFGRELCDVVEYADILTDGSIERFGADELDFSYRSSSVRDKGALVGLGLRLVYGDGFDIARDMKGYKLARQASQPQGASLGSVFKKADGISAGYYIDKAGLKGRRIGGAVISPKHANFIINEGGATSSDFLALANYARQEVDKKWGVKLQYEIDVI